jgi:Fe-S cluster assembly protein SufD
MRPGWCSWTEDSAIAPPVVAVRVGAPGYGALAEPERERMVALNTMLAEDGASIGVPEGADGGLVLLVNLGIGSDDRPVAFHPRHAVRLGARASLTLFEVSLGTGAYLHNAVSEITLGDGARLAHLRLQDEPRAAFHVSTVYADVAARATYDSFLLTLGARLARAEVHARLSGEGASAHLNAAQLLGGAQHADFTTVVTHAAPRCASRQTVKNVLAGRSRGVFQGKIEVAAGAQKTDGYQMNQALLLSPDAEVDSKPQLEIFADDVKCSHGATVGELDPEQLFYLRSRGIAEAEARALLVRAFLAESLDLIADTHARAALETAIARRWEGFDA